MNHRATRGFWDCYQKLPAEIRQLADACFALLKQNSRHPSLHFKRIDRLWSARVGLHYRALAAQDGDDYVWFWIGTHDEYDRLIQ